MREPLQCTAELKAAAVTKSTISPACRAKKPGPLKARANRVDRSRSIASDPQECRREKALSA
jgi:hypothetical protein